MKYWCLAHTVLLGTFYGFTRHLLSFTNAQHLLHFHSSTPKLFSAPTVWSAPKHFYLAHTRFFIFLVLTKKSARHELTCLAPTNEFSQALQTALLQLILLMFLSVTNLCIFKYIINTSFYQCLNGSLYFITIIITQPFP